jgi:hypothetical protein
MIETAASLRIGGFETTAADPQGNRRQFLAGIARIRPKSGNRASLYAKIGAKSEA